ncbi:MAG: hypothetical protein RMY29_029460 [Nostoc sp. CreGUA01]
MHLLTSCPPHYLPKTILRVPASPPPPKFRSPEAGAPTSLRVSLYDKYSTGHDMTRHSKLSTTENTLFLKNLSSYQLLTRFFER